MAINLVPKQAFQVIFFSSGRMAENSLRRLDRATEAARREAVAFTRTMQASDTTEVLPAIRRAFEVIRRAPGGSARSVIYLLTDGQFADNSSIVETIRRLNGRGAIRIHTVLHHHHDPVAERVGKRIAQDNRGEYRFVAPGS